MKIIWNQNPFKTSIVDINDGDRRNILKSIQNEEYAELLCGLDCDIHNESEFTLQKAGKRIQKWCEIADMEEDHEKVNRVVAYLNTEHIGDCTCMSSTCARCVAEDYLGINTKKGCGKHQFKNIQSAFEGDVTIDIAIAKLEEEKEYVKPENWPDVLVYEDHVPRWKREKKEAAEWLKKYKAEHSF
jgi:hypothetical protein